MNKLFTLSIVLLAVTSLSVRAADVTGETKALYKKECAKCHGDDGKGDTKMGKKLDIKDYTDAKVQAEMKDEVAFKSLKEGLKDKAGKTLMKPYNKYTDAELKALVAFMRTFKKS